MSHNPANSQRPSCADPARKQTPGDADRRTISLSSAALPSDGAAHQPIRHVASTPPAQYGHFPPGYHNVPLSINVHPHHHPGQQTGTAFPSYGNPALVDAYGYINHPFHPGRHNADSHHFARPPHRTKSLSSGSGSAPSPLDVVPGSHFPSHFSPSYPVVSMNPSTGHSGGRTRWAWVPIEVPQTHLPDDAHLQYAPYPGHYYPSPATSATSNASSSHQSYQQPFVEGSTPATAAYGMQASPSYASSYPFHLHPAQYGPHPSHTSHTPVVAPGRGSWSSCSQANTQLSGAARDNITGTANRRQTKQSGRLAAVQRRTASNASGHHASPHTSHSALPHRPTAVPLDAKTDSPETGALPPQPLDLVGDQAQPEIAVLDAPASASDEDREIGGQALADVTNAERVPGNGLRPHFHPQQGPRSEWVLWCGNVPQDATVEELWEVFSRLTPGEYRNWLASPEGQELTDVSDNPEVVGHGVLSIFIISRSNCAFVNYASPGQLDRAVKYFHGKQVRPRDPRCPKLVCRVRKKDDEAQAGVAGQRGRGIHVAWLKQQRELERAQTCENSISIPGQSSLDSPSKLSNEPMSPPSQKDSGQIAAGLVSTGSYSSSGSASYASTNSSLFRHPAFRHRFFILKSLRSDDLDRSIETGYWATQPHNENVLDQAYRNSETVYLIFGVNQTGQFYGYAKMAGPIHTTTADAKSKEEHRRRSSLSSVLSAASSSHPPAAIPKSADENANEADPVMSGAGSRQFHPTLDMGDMEAARGLFGNLSVDGVGEASHSLPMTSPLPLSPTSEEVGFNNSLSPQRNDTITARAIGSIAQSSTWPYTSTRGSSSEANSERPKLALTLSDEAPVARVTAEPDEYGVRRIDMETESAQTNSSQSDQPSLEPGDSASWSSADPRMAEQIALRAVIHNLRLDEMESRGKAEKLENQLRSSSNDTNATVTAKDSELGAGDGNERTPPRQSSSDSWGKPFRVEWIRTDPLPFQRVKKLRNPWRDNRQVKVSRDGTELEPGAGRQLLEEWNRLHSSARTDSFKERKAAETDTAASDEDE